jgi:hypothetical protein
MTEATPKDVWPSKDDVAVAGSSERAAPVTLPLPLGLSGLDVIAHTVNEALKEGATATAKETGTAQVTIEVDGLASEQRLQAALAAAEEVTPPGVEIVLLYCTRRIERPASVVAE